MYLILWRPYLSMLALHIHIHANRLDHESLGQTVREAAELSSGGECLMVALSMLQVREVECMGKYEVWPNMKTRGAVCGF